MVKKAVSILCLLLFVAAVTPLVPGCCLANDSVKETKVVDGGIVDVDWVGQKVVVRWLQSEGRIKYDEITIFVPDATKITKGADTVALFDLNIADQVTVEYYDSSPGPLKAVSIKVQV